MSGDGVFFTAQDDDEGARTLALAKTMCGALNTPELGTFWNTETMMWYGPSGIGTTRGLDAFVERHQDKFDHAFPAYGSNHMGDSLGRARRRHLRRLGRLAEYPRDPGRRVSRLSPVGKSIEWRLMDYAAAKVSSSSRTRFPSTCCMSFCKWAWMS